MAPEEESGPGDQAPAGRPPPVAEGWSPLIRDRRVFRLDPKTHTNYRDEWRQKYIDFWCALLGADRRVADAVDELAGPADEAIRLHDAAQAHYELARRIEAADDPGSLPPLSVEARFGLSVADGTKRAFHAAVNLAAYQLAAVDRLPIPHDIRVYYLYAKTIPPTWSRSWPQPPSPGPSATTLLPTGPTRASAAA